MKRTVTTRLYQLVNYQRVVNLRLGMLLLCLVSVSACTNGGSQITDESPSTTVAALALAPDETIQVAATTSIIGDVIAQIGAEKITLFTLIPPNVDPHSYTPTPQDLRTLSDVDVIFINDLHLEEGLADLLAQSTAPQISVNGNATLLSAADEAHEEGDGQEEEDEHGHGAYDPHTWQNVANVQSWVPIIAETLSTLDPTNETAYQAAAERYNEQLATLDQELRDRLTAIPAEQRKLVTDHESFAYFAAAYDFTIVGTLIPSLSSLAESSAQGLAALQGQISAEAAPAIFVGTTTNPELAQQLANDLGVQVVPLYSDALSDSSGPAATYVDFMRYNVNAIVTALTTAD